MDDDFLLMSWITNRKSKTKKDKKMKTKKEEGGEMTCSNYERNESTNK
jgi:hypothetical protein